MNLDERYILSGHAQNYLCGLTHGLTEHILRLRKNERNMAITTYMVYINIPLLSNGEWIGTAIIYNEADIRMNVFRPGIITSIDGGNLEAKKNEMVQTLINSYDRRTTNIDEIVSSQDLRTLSGDIIEKMTQLNNSGLNPYFVNGINTTPMGHTTNNNEGNIPVVLGNIIGHTLVNWHHIAATFPSENDLLYSSGSSEYFMYGNGRFKYDNGLIISVSAVRFQQVSYGSAPEVAAELAIGFTDPIIRSAKRDGVRW